MGDRGLLVGGMAAGVLAGGLLLALLVVLLPGPVAPPVGTADPSVTPSGTPVAPGASATPDTAGVGFHLGEEAPPLRVPRLGGGEIELSELRGQPVWVNFMATWCPPCRDELPLMNSFHVRYAADGLQVVAVDVREDEATVAALMDELQVQFPVGLDTDARAQQDWGAYALPVHFWIDRDGIVRDGALGGIGPDVMVDALTTLLPGVDIEP